MVVVEEVTLKENEETSGEINKTDINDTQLFTVESILT